MSELRNGPELLVVVKALSPSKVEPAANFQKPLASTSSIPFLFPNPPLQSPNIHCSHVLGRGTECMLLPFLHPLEKWVAIGQHHKREGMQSLFSQSEKAARKPFLSPVKGPSEPICARIQTPSRCFILSQWQRKNPHLQYL